MIRQIREKLYQPGFQALTAVDFLGLAQSRKTYDEFMEKMGRVPESALRYVGLPSAARRKRSVS